MIVASPLDTASSWLTASNILYLVGSGLTVITALFVLYENRAITLGKRAKFYLLSEIAVVASAILSLTGSIGAIHFANVVAHIKDVDLATYKTSADIKITQARLDAATAYGIAAQALHSTALLQTDLASHESQERVTNARLTAKETFDYNNVLAQQKAASQQNMVMAQQAKLSPVLDDLQITALGNSLKLFAGQDVIFHSTGDTTVLRSKVSIERALQAAGLTAKENSIDLGQIYQGISVVVHSPQDVPPLANALVIGLRAAGITVNTVSSDTVPSGRVALYFGPN